jgi:L-ascorbate metabolism protein UlaG (beta-lactamase superfamily)
MPLKIRWFPPSWVQLQAGHSLLYIDPAYLQTYFTSHPGHIQFTGWPDAVDGLPEKLEAGDLILVTHHHKDHAKKVTIDRLTHPGTRLIAPQVCLKELGPDFQVVRAGEEVVFKDGTIRVVQAYNMETGSSTRKIHHKNQGVGYLVTVAGKTVYHAGDSDFIPEMLELGKVDVALLPIGGTYTMDIEEAVRAACAIHPAVVIPVHYLDADPQQFKQKLESLSDTRVVCLKTGEEYLLQ